MAFLAAEPAEFSNGDEVGTSQVCASVPEALRWRRVCTRLAGMGTARRRAVPQQLLLGRLVRVAHGIVGASSLRLQGCILRKGGGFVGMQQQHQSSLLLLQLLRAVVHVQLEQSDEVRGVNLRDSCHLRDQPLSPGLFLCSLSVLPPSLLPLLLPISLACWGGLLFPLWKWLLPPWLRLLLLWLRLLLPCLWLLLPCLWLLLHGWWLPLPRLRLLLPR